MLKVKRLKLSLLKIFLKHIWSLCNSLPSIEVKWFWKSYSHCSAKMIILFLVFHPFLLNYFNFPGYSCSHCLLLTFPLMSSFMLTFLHWLFFVSLPFIGVLERSLHSFSFFPSFISSWNPSANKTLWFQLCLFCWETHKSKFNARAIERLWRAQWMPFLRKGTGTCLLLKIIL